MLNIGAYVDKVLLEKNMVHLFKAVTSVEYPVESEELK